jgi:anti-anti-sigma regulatory factor
MTNPNPLPDPLPDDVPYRIERADERRAIVRFAEICDHERTAERRRALNELIATVDEVVCDLTNTRTIVSGWIRLLEQLSVDAERMGKRFIVAGVSEIVKKSADIIGVGERLTIVKTVEQGWAD